MTKSKIDQFGSMKSKISDGVSASLSRKTNPSPKSQRPPSSKTKKDRTDESLEELNDWSIAVLDREGTSTTCALYNKPWVLLVALCALAFAQSMTVHGVFPASITQLQWRFQFTDEDMAMIRAMYDGGACFMLLPIIFFENSGRRSRWIGLGTLVISLGASLCTVPHYTAGMFDYNINKRDVCRYNDENPLSCPPALNWYKWVMGLGHWVMGMGSTTMHTMAIAYMDENVSHQQSTVYTAIFALFELIGPAVGFVATGQLLHITGDFDKMGVQFNSFGVTGTREFYGAWWLGMLICAILLTVGAGLIFPFPPQLSGAVTAHVQDAHQVMQTERDNEARDGRSKWHSGVLNFTYVSLVIENCCRSFVVGGFVTFLPKHLETVFELTSGESAFFTGTVIVLCAAGGLLLGTIIQHVMKLEMLGNLRMTVFCCAASLLFSAVVIIKCPTTPLAGVTVHYPGSNVSGGAPTLTVPCNEKCNCYNDQFFPYCYINREGKPLTFYNRCYAGCEDDLNRLVSNQSYCACLPTASRFETRTRWMEGKCQTGCSRKVFYAFLIGIGWAALTVYARANAVQQLLLRCVPFHRRVVALTLAQATMRLLATIPGPFMFGHILTMSCASWVTRCPARWCTWYDTKVLSVTMVIGVSMLGALGLAASSAALIVYTNTKSRDKQTSTPPREKQTSTTPTGRTPSAKKSALSSGKRGDAKTPRSTTK